MIIVPYKAEHLLAIQVQPAQAYCKPFITEEYARLLEGPYAFAGLVDGMPVGVGGVVELWEHRGLAWTYMDHRAGRYFTAIHRAVKKALEAAPYRRIEADTPCDFVAGHRWLMKLGFQLEAPVMKAYRIDGGDSALYAKVRG